MHAYGTAAMQRIICSKARCPCRGRTLATLLHNGVNQHAMADWVWARVCALAHIMLALYQSSTHDALLSCQALKRGSLKTHASNAFDDPAMSPRSALRLETIPACTPCDTTMSPLSPLWHLHVDASVAEYRSIF